MIKKFILFKILFGYFFFLLFIQSYFSISNVLSKEPQLTCAQINKIVDSKECQNWIRKPGIGVWCNMPYGDFEAWKKYPVTYTYPPGDDCDSQTSDQTGQLTPPAEKKPQANPVSDTIRLIDNLINETFGVIDLTNIEIDNPDKNILDRTPQLTDEMLKKDREEWEDIYSQNKNKTASPYKVDILDGQVQIRYPGETSWHELKSRDKIPPGSTIFTGMDATTVLSIRDKGVVQILSFTEVTITEEGLADPSKTTTEIKLQTGEIELNVPGVYTGFDSFLNVSSEYTTTGVRGTHFWVSHDSKKKTDTIGVYEGQVEVKTKDEKTTRITPNNDKPGVVIVTQKLSVAKFAIAGLIVIVITGGGIFLFKTLFSPHR